MTRLFERWAIDPALVLGTLGLTLFGIAMIYSAGVVYIPNPVTEHAWMRQAIWFGLALLGFTVLSRVPLRWIEWLAVPAYAISLVLLAATLVIGTGAGTAAGVKSWIQLGPLRFQPSEFAKIATILVLARLLSQRLDRLTSLKDLIAPAALVCVPLALVMRQPDLGTAMAFIGILFAMLFWAGTPVVLLLLVASPVASLVVSFDTLIWSWYILAVVGLLYYYRDKLYFFESVMVVLANFAAGTISRPLWNSLAQYQRNRILVYLDPEVDPRNAGYQVIQSKVAIGSGGLTGKGFTLGTQKRFDFLPEQHTDFIFSVVGEELGFVGVVVLLALFAWLLRRMITTATLAANEFGNLVVFCLFAVWFIHLLINVGMTVGLMPITGLPLPFISYGGSFLLMTFVGLALASRVAMER